MRDDLPRIAAHTAAGGPKKAKDFVISTGLELRKRIPLARFAPLLRRAAAQKSRSAKIVLDGAGRAGAGNYLISTLAPASSNFFLIAAASSLLTPSLTVFGAPSTRSLASFRPRLVTSRTALMTLILLPPTSVSTTENSVFSSAGAAPPAAPAPPPPAATTVAAAAETPKASSIFFTSSDASSNVSPLISSRIVSTFAMTLCSPLKTINLNLLSSLGRFGSGCSAASSGPKLVGLDGFVHDDRQVARQGVQRDGNALRRSIQQEHDLADELFLGGQVRELP